MCGRYTLTRRQNEIAERFAAVTILTEADEIQPRYNIAPSQMVPVVMDQGGKRALAMLKWGLIPFWAKDLTKIKPVMNARCETIFEKPFFKQAASKRRCIIPADGFYEWQRVGTQKTPMYMKDSAGALLGFAGLWDEWTSTDGEVLRTCTIITTTANDKIAGIHDRMPVILRPEHENLWLDSSVKDVELLKPVFEPSANELLDIHPVSSQVNSSRYDLPEMVLPVR